MKKRIGYFNIDNVMIGEHTNFDISFDITYQGNSLVALPARFSIDNLKQDTINYIATNTQLFEERRRHIQFFCGYEDNVRKIFDGEISRAIPSGQPDRTLSIEAWTSTEVMGTNVGIQAENISCIDLIKQAANACGYSWEFSSAALNSPKLQRTLPEFSHTGSEYDFLRRVISDITGFNVVKDQVLFCIDGKKMFISLADETNTLLPVREISAGTGLIGIPEPSVAGVNLRLLLDVTLCAGQTIKLNSKVLPLYNGLYNIWAITHHGSLRGTDFYTDLICQRVYGQGEYGVKL